MVCRKLLAVVSVAGLLLGANVAAAAEPADYQRTIDLTFPVAGRVWYADWYDAPRSGGARPHQATDVMAAKLQGIHAAQGGVVSLITGVDEPMPTWGYAIYIRGDDGLTYAYLHINNDRPDSDDGAGGRQWAYAPGLREGSRVERGQWIGYVGDSGAAENTDPHLHFEIHDPDLDDPALVAFCRDWERCDPHRVNPYASLVEAQQRGDVPQGSATPRPRPTSSPAPQPTPTSPPAAEVVRLAGPDRVLTAVALSQARLEARTVVVVPAGSHVEALVAAPLAGLVDAPVLLADERGLAPEVVDEVRRLGARNAYLLGRPDRLPASVEDQLADSGITAMARLQAPDRYELSALVAREILSYPQVDRFDSALLALGDAADPSRAWPDALSATALAARLGVPILLTRGDALPDPIRDVLGELRPDTVHVVGGRAAVSEAAARHAAEAGSSRLERIAGATRYATSAAVARAGVAAGLDSTRLWTATGRNYPDALAAGPAAARGGAPLLLVDGARVGGSPEADQWLADQAGHAVGAVVVGGPAAVSEAVAVHVGRLLEP